MTKEPLPSLPLIDGCLFIDNSGWVEGFSTCYRYLEYKQLHLRIPSADKPSLNFGSAIHLALEYRYSRYKTGSVPPSFYNELAVIFQPFFADHPTPVEDWRNINWAVEVVKKYMEKYDVEAFNLLKPDKLMTCPHCHGKASHLVITQEGARVGKCLWCDGTGQRDVMVELPFSLPLFTWIGNLLDENGECYSTSIPIIYSGRIDLPMLLDGDAIWVSDHKTSSMLGTSFFERMKMSSQQKGYAWAFTQLTGKPVAGYMINAIRTKEPPQYVLSGKAYAGKTASTPEQWWSESLQRERYVLKPGELDEWKQNTIALVEEFFYNYQRGYMPMKTAWCTQFGRCAYYDVCSLAAEDRGVMLNSGLYAPNTWSPLNQPSQAKQ